MTTAPAQTPAQARWFVPAFVLLCLLSLALLIVSAFDRTIWFAAGGRCDGGDLLNYYYATQAWLNGVSPYDQSAIAARFGQYAHYVYPIYALPLFLPLLAFDFDTARLVYAALQLAAVAGLMLILRRLLPVDWRLVLLSLPLGFASTLLRDLCHANTVVFETFFLFLAIAFLWRGRRLNFVAALYAAAVPKLLWLALLPLLAHRVLGAYRRLALSLLPALAAAALWLALWPHSFWHWLANVRVTTSFRFNVFTLGRWLRETLGGAGADTLLGRWEFWTYAIWLALVGAVVMLAMRRGAGLRTLSLFLPLSLLAMWPGNGVYSWVPLLPIAAVLVFFLASRGDGVWAFVLATLCLAPWQAIALIAPGLPWLFAPLLATVALWLAAASVVLRQPIALELWLAQKQAH